MTADRELGFKPTRRSDSELGR